MRAWWVVVTILVPLVAIVAIVVAVGRGVGGGATSAQTSPKAPVFLNEATGWCQAQTPCDDVELFTFLPTGAVHYRASDQRCGQFNLPRGIGGWYLDAQGQVTPIDTSQEDVTVLAFCEALFERT